MKRYFFFAFLLFILYPNVYAQGNGTVTITGTVVDASTQELIEQAGIRVLHASDSSYVKGVGSNSFGKFTISVAKGRYIVHTSFLGYTDVYTNVNANKAENILGKILMKDDGILLSEAVVVAKAPEIVVKGDTVEYNADSYKVQESAVLEDLVKKMPGAEISTDGKITINGKEIKKILVDGKEFFSNDPKVASKNLPAKMIDKLQVLDRKTDMAQMTGFDDGEEETVINLTVKKGMKEGVFGNTFAGYGSENRYEANAMINAMRNNNQFTLLGGGNNTNNAGFSDFATTSFGGMNRPRGLNFGGNNGILKSYNGGFNFATELSPKLKWGGDARYGRTDNDVRTDSYAEYLSTNPDSVQFETKKNRGNNIGDNFNVNLRFEWTPDSLTKVIFRPNVTYSKNSSEIKSDYLKTWGNINDSIYWGNSDYYSKGDGYDVGANLDISRQLSKTGRVLSVSLSGGFNNQTSDGFNRSTTNFLENDSISAIDQIFGQKNKGYNWRGYLSYVEPLGRNNFLQLTYSYRKRYSESDKSTFKDDGSGNHSVIDTASTRKLENDFVNQEIGLNFKSIRKNFNYTVGLSLQPSSSESWNIPPGSRDFAIKTTNNVFNFSPMAQFNYIWSKRKNLRVDYKGVVNQPSITQLSTARDESDPMNISYGNPYLKPSFENRLNLRFRNFNPEKASAFMLFGGFSFTSDDIANYEIRNNKGGREITYKNVDGNWKANMRMIINRPLSNPKFSINSMTYGGYTKSNGFANEAKNAIGTTILSESMGLEYRSDLFDFGIRGNFRYTGVSNSLQGQRNSDTYNYGGNANTTIYLPYNFTFDTDLNYATNSGYSTGFDQSEWLWNASLSKQIFKAKNGTVRFKIYDILQEKSNISRTTTETSITDVSTNTLKSYFMFHFVYRFQIFKGGAKAADMDTRRGYGGGRHGG